MSREELRRRRRDSITRKILTISYRAKTGDWPRQIANSLDHHTSYPDGHINPDGARKFSTIGRNSGSTSSFKSAASDLFHFLSSSPSDSRSRSHLTVALSFFGRLPRKMYWY